MPGLLTLRPLASAAKAAKSTAARNAALSATRVEKGRDDARTQGQGRAVSPAFSRGRVARAPAALHRNAPAAPPATPHPAQHLRQPQHAAPAQAREQGALGGAGWTSAATAAKQVKDPVVGSATAVTNDNRIGGKRVEGIDYSSSGSEHEPNSVCLAEMVYDYIEDDLEVSKCGRARCNCGSNCSSGDRSPVKENDEVMTSLGGEIAEVLKGLIPCVNLYESSILSSVTSAMSAVKGDDSDSDDRAEVRELARSPSTRRLMMRLLRSSGYNAAICKSRWEHVGGFPGGDYEYIDVIIEGGGVGKKERIIVDVDFKAQFEIARPTSLYSALLQSLPSIYVGKSDRLQQILNIMCDSAKRSLKKKGLHLPPWRKPEYIKAKWFSAYRRTANWESSSSTKSPDAIDIGQIALRGSVWDSKFTSEMEKSYIKAADLKMALRQCTGEEDRRALVETKPTVGPEGQVRGANLMGFLGHVSEKSTVGGDNDLTLESDWEPPSVIPRTSTQRAAAGKVGGLVSILKESIVTEAGRLSDLSQEPVAIPAFQHIQAGVLSTQMAVA